MNQPPSSSSLAEDLERVAVIKAEMMQLLRELEQTAAGHPIKKAGAWRHHPERWNADNLS